MNRKIIGNNYMDSCSPVQTKSSMPKRSRKSAEPTSILWIGKQPLYLILYLLIGVLIDPQVIYFFTGSPTN